MTRIKDALDAVTAAILAQKNYLTKLDEKIGDGDHGINMARGFTAAQEAVAEMDDTTQIGPVLITIGQALIHNVGGAAGPLYGIGFVKAGEACNAQTQLDVKSCEKLLAAGIAAIQARGHAQKGDKTMLDTLIPLHAAFLSENAGNKAFFTVLREAASAASRGAEYTKTIAARKGRAALVGERSIGVEDPGAMSANIMFRALYQFLSH